MYFRDVMHVCDVTCIAYVTYVSDARTSVMPHEMLLWWWPYVCHVIYVIDADRVPFDFGMSIKDAVFVTLVSELIKISVKLKLDIECWIPRRGPSGQWKENDKLEYNIECASLRRGPPQADAKRTMNLKRASNVHLCVEGPQADENRMIDLNRASDADLTSADPQIEEKDHHPFLKRIGSGIGCGSYFSTPSNREK